MSFQYSLANNSEWVRLDRCCWNRVWQNISILISSNNPFTWSRNSPSWRGSNCISHCPYTRACLTTEWCLQFLHSRGKNKTRWGDWWSKLRSIGLRDLKRSRHFICNSRKINWLIGLAWYYIMKSYIFSYWWSRLITRYGLWREH